MDIVVLVKQVPNTTDVKLDKNTGNLIREGLESIMNPDDRNALEFALQIKAEYGGTITMVSMGPPQAVDVLSEAMGMGADKGLLLSDMAFAGADTWATSYTLGKAIEKIERFDLIICGRQAIDGDTAQIGPQVADFLDIPQITYVTDIETVSNKEVIVKRRLEDGHERVASQLPALLTILGGANNPRYPNIGGLLAACEENAPLAAWNAADIGVMVNDVGLAGSLTHVIKTYVPKFKRQGETLEGTTAEVVRQLIQHLGKSEGASACKAVAATCRLMADTKQEGI
ncbi:MAG: electron transfer flavoprotein subunit beta/FixA family protein [Desulfobacteraceae bacterium]|nr:electron transfer flavoprotein subunit beta/FixA family protein [Desulfobacteraceae bacterium]